MYHISSNKQPNAYLKFRLKVGGVLIRRRALNRGGNYYSPVMIPQWLNIKNVINKVTGCMNGLQKALCGWLRSLPPLPLPPPPAKHTSTLLAWSTLPKNKPSVFPINLLKYTFSNRAKFNWNSNWKYKTPHMLIFVFIIIIPNDWRTYKQVHLL